MTKGHDNSGIGSAMDPQWTPAMDQAVNDARQLERDLHRITAQQIHATMAGLASHLANGCPPGAHRSAGLGLCRHKVQRPARTTASVAGQTVPVYVTELCGEPLPCPHHPQDVELTDVEADALRRMETDRRVADVAHAAAQARMAVARLLGAVLASEKLTSASGPVVQVERCSGGFGGSLDPTCTAGVVKRTYWQGLEYGTCLRCWERCRRAERNNGLRSA